MDTWKNNNVLTRFKESYFIENTGGDRASGLPVDAKPVGGTIFYIDGFANGIYEFFDADGNVIENVRVGDKPNAYRVVSAGTRDKYYVYHDELCEGRWANREDDEDEISENESLGTSEDTGSGRTNTGIAMATSSSFGRYPTIWYRLQQIRNVKAGGCNDWFIPSKDEVEKLRLAIKSGSVTGGTIARSSYDASAFGNKYLWSSSEYSSQSTWLWSPFYHLWGGYYKYGDSFVFFIRAF